MADVLIIDHWVDDDLQVMVGVKVLVMKRVYFAHLDPEISNLKRSNIH